MNSNEVVMVFKLSGKKCDEFAAGFAAKSSPNPRIQVSPESQEHSDG